MRRPIKIFRPMRAIAIAWAMLGLMAGCTLPHIATISADPGWTANGSVSVNFPAYQVSRDENKDDASNAKPFTATFTLPAGWEIRLPDVEDRPLRDEFYTAVNLYFGDTCVGFIGYNVFTPYTEEIPAEDYYKTVYSNLRLGSMYFWDPYRAVKTTDTTETGIATVEYLDPDEIDKHPGAMVDVPHIKVPGILSFDKELQVYIGIQFAEDVVTDEQVRDVAESIVLSPQ